MKFKVGDKVKVSSSLFINEEYDDGCRVDSAMAKHKGRVATISFAKPYCNNANHDRYHIDIAGGWWWSESMLETVSKTLTDSITYHINPPVTVCILPGKYKGIARCNPADAWDEDKGKMLALVRALESKIAKGGN